jgi:TolB-like protein
MADIFLSYSREDRAAVEPLADALVASGYSVWWDKQLTGGKRYLEETEAELNAAKAVLVVWSKTSIVSHWVADEAGAGRDTGRLLPISLDGSMPPLGFRQFQVIDFSHWRPQNDDTQEMFDLLGALKQLSQPSGAAKSAPASKRASPSPMRHPMVIGGIAMASFVIFAAVLFVALRPRGEAPATQSQRVAFFGFTADGADAASTALSISATNEAFSIFNARRVDIAARAETTGSQTQPRLERAKALGARYALSGDVHTEAGVPKIAMRLEDVPTRTTLWEATLDGGGAAQVAAVAAASRAVSITDCITTKVHTAETPDWDAALLPLVAPACVAGDTPGQEQQFVTMLRELAQKDPRNGGFQTALAFRAAELAPKASSAARTGLLKEAHDALARAGELGSHGYHTALPNFALAIAESRPPLDWAPQIEAALQAPPKPSETFLFARANNFAGRAMLAVGRLSDAAAYFKASRDADPIEPENSVMYALTLAALNRLGWQSEFESLQSRFWRGYVWEAGAISVVLIGKGDADKVLADRASGVSSEALGCYKTLHGALTAPTANARLAGVRKADACLIAYDSPAVAATAAAMAGDLDRAFDLVDTPEKSLHMMRLTFAPWFLPKARPMRADPRFLPLMQKLGYVDYWKQTKTKPDICTTPEESGIPLCKALAG